MLGKIYWVNYIVKLFNAISVIRPLDEEGLKKAKSNFFHKYKGFDYFYDI